MGGFGVRKWGPKIVKNGPWVWAFCKIEFPGIQKPVQFFGQKSGFFRNPGNRGVGVIWLVWVGFLFVLLFLWWWLGLGLLWSGGAAFLGVLLFLYLLGGEGFAGIKIEILLL